MYFTVPPNGVAKLHFGAGPAQPTLERWTSTASRSWTSVTLATLGEVLLEPTLTTLGNFLVRSNSQWPWPASSGRLPAGGLCHDSECLCLDLLERRVVSELFRARPPVRPWWPGPPPWPGARLPAPARSLRPARR